MSDSGRSFWHTAPGVITAVAALITALGGVLAVLVQNDLIGRSGDRGGELAIEREAPGSAALPAEVAAPARGSPPSGSLTPWASADATLTRRDGTGTTVRAPTVGLACATETVEFKNGQRVRLDLVRSIRVDAVYMENGSADGVVTLLDGRELTDPIHTWNCPVTGASDLGPVSIELANIRRIDFHR